MKAHCNNTNCQKEFEVSEKRTNKFYGSAAVRTSEFYTCPHCGHGDWHWFYASDEMPSFEGNPNKVRRQQLDWMEEN